MNRPTLLVLLSSFTVLAAAPLIVDVGTSRYVAVPDAEASLLRGGANDDYYGIADSGCGGDSKIEEGIRQRCARQGNLKDLWWVFGGVYGSPGFGGNECMECGVVCGTYQTLGSPTQGG